MNSWRENIPYLLLAIVLSVGLWFYVESSQNPVTEAYFNVPLELKNVPQQLMVAAKPSLVEVKVKGNINRIENLTSQDFQAEADLTGAEVGKNKVEVELIMPSGVELISIEPNPAEISLEQIAEKEFKVNAVIKGSVPAEYIALEPELKPDYVLVYGPASILEKAEKVEVTVDIQGARNNILLDLPLKISDERGNSLAEWVIVKPDFVEVFVPITYRLPQKVLTLDVPLNGSVAPGYEIKRVIVEPPTVTVFGEFQLLAPLKFLETTPLNLGGATKTIKEEVEIIVPEGIALDYNQKVQVVVEIGEIS